MDNWYDNLTLRQLRLLHNLFDALWVHREDWNYWALIYYCEELNDPENLIRVRVPMEWNTLKGKARWEGCNLVSNEIQSVIVRLKSKGIPN